MIIDVTEIQSSIIKRSFRTTNIVPKVLLDITEVFEDYFGKDYVELQLRPNRETFFHLPALSNDYQNIVTQKDVADVWKNTFISIVSEYNLWGVVVYRPEVTITNENKNSITIKDLFAIVPVSACGHIRSIYYLRASFSQEQWNKGYIHSHAPQLYETRYLSTPESVCLGYGPINDTINILNERTNSGEFNYMLWKVFVTQLDQIMRVESLTGGPYVYLEDVSTYSYEEVDVGNLQAYYEVPDMFSGEEMLSCFIQSLITDKRIHFCINDGKVIIAEPFADFLHIVTNYYFMWQNFVLTVQNETPILFKINYCKTKNGKVYHYKEASAKGWTPEYVTTFKGVDYMLDVYDDDEIESQEPCIDIKSAYALYNILTSWANYRYDTPRTRYSRLQELSYGNKENTEKRVLYL